MANGNHLNKKKKEFSKKIYKKWVAARLHSIKMRKNSNRNQLDWNFHYIYAIKMNQLQKEKCGMWCGKL